MEYSWYQEGASRHSGTLSSSSFEDGWNDVMDKCSSGFDVQVTLYADWIADDGQFTDDVFNGPGFQDGIIRIRQGASVILDLNGYSIDRGTTLDVKNGEVFHVETDADLTLKNGTIIGSVHITNGKAATFDNCVFKDNEDIDFGAAIFAEGCEELTVENCTFSNLEDDSNGAAIEANRTAITVIGSAFRNCTTEHDGGAVYVENGSLDMTNCQFTGNHATENGGAAYVDQTAQFKALDNHDELARDILPTKFIANEASEKGDVIFIDTPDGGIEEGEEWVEPTEVGRNENVGFGVTDIVLALSVIFVAAAVVLNFRKPK